jgi:hypothetical protein
MKLIYIILFTIMISFAGLAYSGEDTTKVKPEDKTDKTLIKETDPTFKKQKRKKDVFIDKDGDGICDNRANGMSFEKFRKRHQMQRKGSQGNQGGKR